MSPRVRQVPEVRAEVAAGAGHWETYLQVRIYVWSGGSVVLEFENSDDDPTDLNIYGLGKRLARKALDQTGEPVNVYIHDLYGNAVSLIRPDGVPRDHRIEYYPYGDIYSYHGTGWTPHEFMAKERDWTRQLPLAAALAALLIMKFELTRQNWQVGRTLRFSGIVSIALGRCSKSPIVICHRSGAGIINS